jgi:hypothetical protein
MPSLCPPGKMHAFSTETGPPPHLQHRMATHNRPTEKSQSNSQISEHHSNLRPISKAQLYASKVHLYCVSNTGLQQKRRLHHQNLDTEGVNQEWSALETSEMGRRTWWLRARQNTKFSSSPQLPCPASTGAAHAASTNTPSLTQLAHWQQRSGATHHTVSYLIYVQTTRDRRALVTCKKTARTRDINDFILKHFRTRTRQITGIHLFRSVSPYFYFLKILFVLYFSTFLFIIFHFFLSYSQSCLPSPSGRAAVHPFSHWFPMLCLSVLSPIPPPFRWCGQGSALSDTCSSSFTHFYARGLFIALMMGQFAPPKRRSVFITLYCAQSHTCRRENLKSHYESRSRHGPYVRALRDKALRRTYGPPALQFTVRTGHGTRVKSFLSATIMSLTHGGGVEVKVHIWLRY